MREVCFIDAIRLEKRVKDIFSFSTSLTLNYRLFFANLSLSSICQDC